MAEVFGDIETDASRADDGDSPSRVAFATQQIVVEHHLGMFDAGNLRHTGMDAAGDNDSIEPRVFQVTNRWSRIQPEIDAAIGDLAAVRTRPCPGLLGQG